MKDCVRWYLGFVTFRIINVCLIQSQFDPDEYWQNLEPSYCQIFGETNESCPGLTWEWKRRPASTEINSFADVLLVGLGGPVRSYASIVPTLLFYSATKKFGLDSSWMVSRGPVILNAALVAATTDWATWHMSRWFSPSSSTKPSGPRGDRRQYTVAFWCAYCSLTSWFNAYTLVRTYSNSLETALVSLSLALISPELLSITSDNQLGQSKRSTLRACVAFFLGGICAAIRFTCLAAFIPMGIILAWRHAQGVPRRGLSYLMSVCALCGLFGLASTAVLDRYMYGFWAIPVLGNLQFNVVQGNGSFYGTHPFYWYFMAGIPAMAGMLLPILIYDWFCQWDSPRLHLWIIISCYVIAHSWSEHKEFRFLLPMLPLFCLLCAQRIRDLTINVQTAKVNSLIFIGATLNLTAVLYLGLIHQRAPVEVNRAILREASTRGEAGGYGQPTSIRCSRVHYLTGCHSTPLLSHLHDPPSKFDPWFLDCSPGCRADPAVECESDSFTRDPGGFMGRVYFSGSKTCSGTADETCLALSDVDYPPTEFPDFIVCNAEHVREMEASLSLMGMKEIGRFINGVNGIRIGQMLTIGGDALLNPDFTTIEVLQQSIAISLDEMVLFKRVLV